MPESGAAREPEPVRSSPESADVGGGGTAEALDWAGLMRLGLGALRLAPEVFWAMTPGELRLALEGAGLVPLAGAGPMGRRRLSELMAAYPDAEDRGGPDPGRGPSQRGGMHRR